jgi:hypothetical protein
MRVAVAGNYPVVSSGVSSDEVQMKPINIIIGVHRTGWYKSSPLKRGETLHVTPWIGCP